VNGLRADRAQAGQDTYQQPGPSLCASCILLVSVARMAADRITAAIARIEGALTRIDAARDAEAKGAAGSARVVELVNVHEKLREQVAESLRELDDLLTKLED
jgi:hypothetical protein